MNERLIVEADPFELDLEFDESSELFNDELGDSKFDLEADGYAELGDGEDSLESEYAEEAIDPASAMQPRSATAYGKEPLGAETLWEMYESDELFNEGIVSFEYPLYHATDEEMDYFLGKLVRRVSRAARGVAKAAGGVAKGISQGVNAIGKVVPLSTLTGALAHTPMGFAVRAGLGAASAAARGRNVFQGAMRSIAATPLTRFAVDTAAGVARGENILKAAKKAGQAGIGDVRESLRFAAMVAPFVPGIGTGAAAALAAGNALASGERISDALIAGARNAVPGGALAQTAFDMAANLAKGKKLSEAVLDAARSRLPGGPAAKAAFDSALALSRGKTLQDSLIAGGGRLLPKSPYAADVLSFVKKAAAGENLGKAALSSAGNLVMKRIEQRAGPIISRRVGRLPISVQQVRRRLRRVPSLGREVDGQEITMNEQFSFETEPFELDPEFDESSALFNDELEDSEFDLEADGYAELGDDEDSFEGEFAEETIDPEDFEDFEDFEAFDAELAGEEWEDEVRRSGPMPRRAPRPRMRSAPRRRPPQRQTRPPQRPTRRPQRPPKRPPRPAGRGGWPIDSVQEPANAEPVEQGSEYVRWVQSSLNQVLALRLPITGVMSAAARSALRTFQGQQNLPADGIAGPETRKALIEAKVKPSGRADEPSPSGQSQEPSPSAPGQEPSPSGPSEEPSSSGPSQEPATQEPSQPEEFEWLDANEFEWGDEAGDEAFEFSPETGEVGLSGLPESVGKAFRAGLESVAIKLAVAAGVRDETTLANLVFSARHPARRGQKLTKWEPGFKELSREWLDIRNRLVRPAIRITPASKAPSAAPAGGLDMVRVRGISVARQIAPKVEALLAAAEADGIGLGGWGYRSHDKQIALRKSHCGPTHYDIYQKPSSQCTPPTATPGKSMHEKGLAIDITYDGKTITSRNSPAFQWLSRNAEKFGLFNLPSEPWHWSVNGR